ncbi:nitronate monooxygenase [Micromonospora sp. NPDC049559]|uniref:NAD(P)H-dependent flavin oxidoreductase n=1 Tax=Micromonospora sp. NPDC049559 TaxID=3155923 RepID=UPI0034287FF8
MQAVIRSWTRGRLQELLGVRYPVVQGPFGAGPSTVELTAAVSNAGGLGSYGAHALAPDRLAPLVAQLRAATSRPFAVNLWLPQPGEVDLRISDAELARHLAPLRPYLAEVGLPEPTRADLVRPDYHAQIEVLLAAEPPVISFTMGVPEPAVLAEARRRGIVTFGNAATVDEAVALAEAGVDAVVASGSDAGGHRGSFLGPAEESMVGTFSLVPQVADAVPVPVVAAGGVADARGVVAALALGADAVQIGTGFLITEKSGASPAHKRALAGPAARATVLTRAFSGRYARGIPNRLQRELDALPEPVPGYPLQNLLTQALRRTANERGLPDLIHLWSGQAAPLAVARPAADYLASLVADVRTLLGIDG